MRRGGRTETSVSAPSLVRELSQGGIEPAAAAHALYVETRRRLAEAFGELPYMPQPPAADAPAALAVNALALLPVSLQDGTPGAVTPVWLEELHRLGRPDAEHRPNGRWYTPRAIARYMARRALAAISGRSAPEHLRALDPACGCGTLAVPLLEEMFAFERRRHPRRPRADTAARCLEGITVADIDEDALETAAFRLRVAAARLAGTHLEVSPRVLHGDILTADPREVAPDGMDLLVMNPPYLGNRYFEQMPDPAAARTALRRSFGWNDDLYAHFLARAWEWLRPGGAVCAITSDTFLTIPSKRRTRDILRGKALREIVRVSPAAFAAHVNTCVTLTVNAEPELFDVLEYVDAREAPEFVWDFLDSEPDLVGVTRLQAPGRVYAEPDTPFFAPTPRAVALFDRYLHPRADADLPFTIVRLGDVAPAKDCGINSGNVRHRLFFRERSEGLHRLIQGRQTERYIVRWDSPAAKFRWVDVEYRPDPAVKGVGRGGRGSRGGETWSFRGDFRQHLAPQRLFLRQTEDDLFASYLEQDPDDPIYTDNTLFTLLINDEGRRLGISYHYLLGLLNSAFLNGLYHALSQEEGRAQAQVKVGYVNRLPILAPGDAFRGQVESLVRRAIAAQTDRQPIAEIQAQLDALIDDAYGAGSLPPE